MGPWCQVRGKRQDLRPASGPAAFVLSAVTRERGDEALLQASTGNDRVPEGSLGLSPDPYQPRSCRSEDKLELEPAFRVYAAQKIQGGLLGQVSRA